MYAIETLKAINENVRAYKEGAYSKGIERLPSEPLKASY